MITSRTPSPEIDRWECDSVPSVASKVSSVDSWASVAGIQAVAEYGVQRPSPRSSRCSSVASVRSTASSTSGLVGTFMTLDYATTANNAPRVNERPISQQISPAYLPSNRLLQEQQAATVMATHLASPIALYEAALRLQRLLWDCYCRHGISHPVFQLPMILRDFVDGLLSNDVNAAVQVMATDEYQSQIAYLPDSSLSAVQMQSRQMWRYRNVMEQPHEMQQQAAQLLPQMAVQAEAHAQAQAQSSDDATMSWSDELTRLEQQGLL